MLIDKIIPTYKINRNIDLFENYIIDKGMPAENLQNWLNLLKGYITGWKLGWTTWILINEEELLKKINILKSYGIKIIVGGSLSEIVIDNKKWFEYVKIVKKIGIDVIEISEGFTSLKKEPK